MTERSLAVIHPDIRPCNVQGRGGSNRPGQMVCCTHPGCQRKHRVILTQQRITPKEVWAAASQRRWKIDLPARTYLCPEHGAA